MRKNEIPIVKEYCRDKIIKELEKIKAEINEQMQVINDCLFDNDLKEAIEIIDNHIKELKG